MKTKINLSHFVPYELLVNKQTGLIEKAEGISLKYTTREIADMKEVIYDQNWYEDLRGDFDLYYMYRDFTREQDKELFQKNNIRFDITIIPPNKLGKEYVKTAGHFHPEIKDGVSYPEVYEVMHGEGIYLLQNDKISNNIIELIIIKAIAGDQILIPPGYGHITINPSNKEPLIMNNLVSSKFSSIYGPIKENNGAAYLYLIDNSWIKNPKYSEELEISERKPSLISNKPFYLAFLENPSMWEFLNEPWKRSTWL